MVEIILIVLLWVWMAIITAPFWLDEIWPDWRTAAIDRIQGEGADK